MTTVAGSIEFTAQQNTTMFIETENSSALPISSTERTFTMNYGALMIIPIIVFVAMGNILVIVAVAVDRKLRSATNCFLSSLAVADLLVALTVMPPSLTMIINNYEWPFNDDFCGVWAMLDVFFSTSSILHLCMISFDRYMALARPFHHRSSGNGVTTTRIGALKFSQNRPQNLKRAARRIVLVWATAFGIAIPLPIIGKIDRRNIFVEKMCAINIAQFQIYASLVAFFLPLVIMFVMYTLTIRTLRRQARLVSNLLVHNGKSSPKYGRKSSFRRKNSSQFSGDNSHKCVYTAQQFQRRESVLSVEESVLASGNLGLLSCMSRSDHNNMQEIFTSQNTNTAAQKLTPFHSVTKTLRRLKRRFCFAELRRRNKTKNLISEANLHRRYSCPCENDSTIHEEVDGNPAKIVNKFQRKYRSSGRRISSSFKNKAMKSITNEQRASKVLGLIFVLFCLFWCPFFITNVTSRLCTTCDQDLMGELMNWFVWAGYVSSGVNPCVYTLFSRRFRETFSLLLRCKLSEVSQRKLKLSFSRRGSSAMSIRSTGQTGPVMKSSRASIVPALIDVNGIIESPTSSPDISNRGSKELETKLDNTPLLQGYSSQTTPCRMEWRSSCNSGDFKSETKILIPKKLDSLPMRKQTLFNKQKYFRRLFSDSDSNLNDHYFRVIILDKDTEDADNAMDAGVTTGLFPEQAWVDRNKCTSNVGDSWLQLNGQKRIYCSNKITGHFPAFDGKRLLRSNSNSINTFQYRPQCHGTLDQTAFCSQPVNDTWSSLSSIFRNQTEKKLRRKSC